MELMMMMVVPRKELGSSEDLIQGERHRVVGTERLPGHGQGLRHREGLLGCSGLFLYSVPRACVLW